MTVRPCKTTRCLGCQGHRADHHDCCTSCQLLQTACCHSSQVAAELGLSSTRSCRATAHRQPSSIASTQIGLNASREAERGPGAEILVYGSTSERLDTLLPGYASRPNPSPDNRLNFQFTSPERLPQASSAGRALAFDSATRSSAPTTPLPKDAASGLHCAPADAASGQDPHSNEQLLPASLSPLCASDEVAERRPRLLQSSKLTALLSTGRSLAKSAHPACIHTANVIPEQTSPSGIGHLEGVLEHPVSGNELLVGRAVHEKDRAMCGYGAFGCGWSASRIEPEGTCGSCAQTQPETTDVVCGLRDSGNAAGLRAASRLMGDMRQELHAAALSTAWSYDSQAALTTVAGGCTADEGCRDSLVMLSEHWDAAEPAGRPIKATSRALSGQQLTTVTKQRRTVSDVGLLSCRKQGGHVTAGRQYQDIEAHGPLSNAPSSPRLKSPKSPAGQSVVPSDHNAARAQTLGSYISTLFAPRQTANTESALAALPMPSCLHRVTQLFVVINRLDVWLKVHHIEARLLAGVFTSPEPFKML
jgi:hypothetical protein